jgi:hypothetical protein
MDDYIPNTNTVYTLALSGKCCVNTMISTQKAKRILDTGTERLGSRGVYYDGDHMVTVFIYVFPERRHWAY